MTYPVVTPGAGQPWPDGSSNPSPAYSGTFIPEIWSGKLIEKFYDATVLAAIANTDYEGEVRNQGDKVKIRTIPSITINTHEANQALEFERPGSDVVELLIDQGRYFNTILDDVMEVQADIDQLSMWADDASQQMKINIDTHVLANIDVNAANKGQTAGRLSGDIDLGALNFPIELVDRNASGGDVEVVDAITRLGQVLDEQNIPEVGRWLVIPAWMSAMIKRSELRDASLVGDSISMLRNGRLGMIERFTVYMSNLLPTFNQTAGGDATHIYAGHSHGLTFASQLSKVETLRGESTFGTILRGLQVFGWKVVDDTALTILYARKKA